MSVNTGGWEIAATAENPFPTVEVTIAAEQVVQAVASGHWIAVTRADFDQLDSPDPNAVYLIVE